MHSQRHHTHSWLYSQGGWLYSQRHCTYSWLYSQGGWLYSQRHFTYSWLYRRCGKCIANDVVHIVDYIVDVFDYIVNDVTHIVDYIVNVLSYIAMSLKPCIWNLYLGVPVPLGSFKLLNRVDGVERYQAFRVGWWALEKKYLFSLSNTLSL